MSSLLLWFLSQYNSIITFTNNIGQIYKKLSMALKSIYTPESYIFFDGMAHPFLEKRVNVTSLKSAVPQWRYIADQYQFFEWGSDGPTNIENSVTSYSLPILSMEILDGNEVVYDLTEYINNIRVYKSTDGGYSPCIEHILGAWTLYSERVLNPNRNFYVRYIDNDAETILLSIYGIQEEVEVEVDPEKLKEDINPEVSLT